MKLLKYEKTWLAAAIDGEGCLSLFRSLNKQYKRGFSYKPVLTIGNTTKAFCKQAKAICGFGVISIVMKTRLLKDHKRIGKPMYYWWVFSTDLRKLLPIIEQYLVVRRKQALYLIKALALLKGKGFKHTDLEEDKLTKLYLAMRELNRGGILKR